MKRKKRRRIFRAHTAGFFNPDAPFWRGERAEQIVKERVAGYTRKKKRKSSRKTS